MRKHRFIRIIIVIAIFALSLILVDRILTTIPTLCGEIVMTSTSTKNETEAVRLPDGSFSDELTNVELTDNRETIYGVLEQYDWIIVFGALLLTFLICVMASWRYAVAFRAKIKACCASIDADRQANANLLAKVNHLIELNAAHTSDILIRTANSDSSEHTPNCILENSPQIPDQKVTAELLLQIERCEERLTNDQKRYNAIVQEYNANIHTFPLRLFAKLFRLTEQAYYYDAGSEPDSVDTAWV